MHFHPPLAPGVLVRRYKRFLADVEVPGRGVVTMHCANTGAMLGCDTPGSPVWFSTSANPKRKYAHSLELVEVPDGSTRCMVCVNTARPNAIVAEALADGRIAGLAETPLRREVAIPGETGRFDFGLGTGPETYVEVKSVTLCRDGVGAFPDAVSVRARRHAEALGRCVAVGSRAVLLFCVPHTGIRRVTLADEIDPEYGAAVRRAVAAGVEVLAYGCVVTPAELAVEGALPVEL